MKFKVQNYNLANKKITIYIYIYIIVSHLFLTNKMKVPSNSFSQKWDNVEGVTNFQ